MSTSRYCPYSAFASDELADDEDAVTKKKRRASARINEDEILGLLKHMTKVLSREPQTESEKEEYQVCGRALCSSIVA